MKSGEFELAISRYLDGTISPEEFAELEEYLANSEEARELYLDYVDVHNVLDLEISMPRVIHPAFSNVVPVEQIRERQQRRSMIQATMVAAAVLMLLAVVFKFVIVPDRPPLLTFEVAPDTIFAVTHSKARADGSEPEAGTLDKGSQLKLRQGTVKLTLSNGVTSVVQAPANLTLVNEDRMAIREGVAWFHVPANAVGFQVTTPRLQIVDLGTEFGVTCAPHALDQVHLLQGRIEVSHRVGLKNKEVLSGTTARIAGPAGRLNPTPVRAEDFIKTLPSSLPYVHMSFDELEGGGLTVEGTHPSVPDIRALLVRPKALVGPSLSPGKYGNALKLHGVGDFVRTNWPGISGSRPRTVSCWVRLPKEGDFNPAIPLLGWGSMRNNGKWKLHAVPDPEVGGRVARISLGKTWYSTDDIRIDDGGWHHLVAVYYGDMLEDGRPNLAIYVDGLHRALIHRGESGELERFSELYTITDSKDSEPFLIGKALRKRGPSFTGEIDDLFIYDGALSDDSIRRLAAEESLVTDSP
ncbi:LamG-like jellyroll fold domain-containing protein [Haloferula rosea]|uniref:FecR protein n=1 Tax=Haloferula rosea TaxID=490093 RepID=A0A934R9I2_9BACT|nr:LamG-like jellyroll fold domain-containing protein [Haloferula rosea]MBK1825552.1 hypothetical protein [Haloferula rosea]